MSLFAVVILIGILSFLGARECSERSYEWKQRMERMRENGQTVPMDMKIRKRWMDAGTVLLLAACAGVLLLYALYE